FDRYTEDSLARVCRQYVRKRRNVYALPAGWFVAQPRPGRSLCCGLQMQPDSSLDVWVPFFSNELQVVETIARAMPASHRLLVKLHRSDADSYSRADLDRFRRLPGVTLVSPFAQSRAFIDRAAAIVAIQGTIA